MKNYAQWFIVALIILSGCENLSDKEFAEKGVSKSSWLEIDPPPNMPDGTKCYVWYGRNTDGQTVSQSPVCN